MPVTLGTVMMTAPSLSWKISELTVRTIGSHNHLNVPNNVSNVVNSELSLSNWTIQ